MASLIYSVIASFDGFVEDEAGRFDWAAPDEDVHAFFNDIEREVGTYLYGRRMYDTMVFWEHPPDLEEQPPYVREFAELWQAAEKIVYSTTREAASTAKTQIERDFDADSVRSMKAGAGRDLMIGGANLAAQAFDAGLVDECHFFIGPVVIGRGKPALPSGGRVDLELLDQRRFDNGVVYVRYHVRT